VLRWLGERAVEKRVLYVRVTVLQVQFLGCERYMLPGNHTGFRYEPEASAGGVLKIFGDLEEKTRTRANYCEWKRRSL
jgi:hypothetical protein